MTNNADFAGPGGAVAEEDKNMSQLNREQISSLEQELEKAEQDFRKAAESSDMHAVMQAHNRICQLVASLSSAWSETGKPTVFARFFVAPASAKPADMATTPRINTESLPSSPTQTGSQASTTTPEPEVPAEENAIPDFAVLEKQMAELASKMQKCLEVGDMDGMLQANEKMGALSELMTKSEARSKAKKEEQKAAASQAGSSTNAPEGVAPRAISGGWAAGDTMTLARQRAEERKKQAKLTDSSFDVVVGEVMDSPSAQGAAAAASQPGFLSDKMKAKMQESGEQKAPAPKKTLTQDQLREKLEQYNFYEILSVPSTASFEELHRSFFKKIKKLNARLSKKELDDWQFQEFVAALCLAHDVLKFPNARLQYDLVLFGPEGGMSPESAAKQKMMPLKEMIKFSTLIKLKDLTEAIEETRSSGDERELGRYLVEKELLSAEEFDSILFAQKLVSNGKLTVAQFELAMQEMRESNIPLIDTLIASEWIQPSDVFSADFS